MVILTSKRLTVREKNKIESTYHQYKMLTIPTNNKGMMDSVPFCSSILSIIKIDMIEVNAMVIYNSRRVNELKLQHTASNTVRWLKIIYIKSDNP